MTDAAEDEARRRMERVQTMVGVEPDLEAWWVAGFIKGAEWARGTDADD